MQKPIKILICNTYTLFREGIKAIFRGQGAIEVVGEADSASKAIDMVKQLAPDVLLMDVVLSDASGFEAIRRVKEANPAIKVLVLTMYDDEKLISRCLEAGASGYVLRDAEPTQLVDAINTVEKGGEYPKAA